MQASRIFTVLVLATLVFGPSPALAQFPAPTQERATPPAAVGELPAQSEAIAVPSDQNGSTERFTPYMLGDLAMLVANLASDIKIAEGESPRPIDRVFYKFNYYNNISKNRFSDPFREVHGIDLYRNVFGFEKTLFGGRASLGLRVPFNTVDAEAKQFALIPTGAGPVVGPGGPAYTATHFGNISAIIKAIVAEDAAAGWLVSGGATLSFPTASSLQINPGASLLSFLQPFGGFIVDRGDFFAQGFSSITFPVARPESIIMFNDLGVGYYLLRDASGGRALTMVAPTFEVHVTTPLRQAEPVTQFGVIDDLRIPNTVNLTLGTTFEFYSRAAMAIAAVTPITGPKPFDIEALAQFNYRF